ncbi:MAG TPA: hypothetical protein VF700_11575 [Segetibacter sp.]
MRGWSICFFINLFVYIPAKSQHLFPTLSSAKKQIVYDTSKQNGNPVIPSKSGADVNCFLNSSVNAVPSSFYFNSLGFFCQKELQMEKVIRVPIKFRLGSVAHTDQMEGKVKGAR